MKSGTRAAVAIGLGYALGHKHKMRLAGIMAAAAAAGGLSKRGMKAIASTSVADKLSPQARELTEYVREDLVTAGKAAASAAVNHRAESFTSSMHDRAEALRRPVQAGEEAAHAAAESMRGAGERATRPFRGDEDG